MSGVKYIVGQCQKYYMAYHLTQLYASGCKPYNLNCFYKYVRKLPGPSNILRISSLLLGPDFLFKITRKTLKLHLKKHETVKKLII